MSENNCASYSDHVKDALIFHASEINTTYN